MTNDVWVSVLSVFAFNLDLINKKYQQSSLVQYFELESVFQNTLIQQQQFQKKMETESFLQVKKVVWAKIESYPWWPGKIVEIIEQDNLLVYKVSFFGDASYSYLHQQNIIPYEFFDINLNNSFLIDSKLQKAIEQAKRVAEKKQLSFRSTDEEISSFKQQITLSSAPTEPANHNNQPLYTQTQLPPNNEDNQQSLLADIISNPITIDNVIDLIKISTTFLNIQGHCYSNRKEIIYLQKQLQEKLLDKYNLSKFQFKQCPKKPQKQINARHIYRLLPKRFKKIIQKRRNLKSSQQIRTLMIKKIYRKLKDQGLEDIVSKQKSLQLCNQLIINYGGMTTQLKQVFVKMARDNDQQKMDKVNQV